MKKAGIILLSIGIILMGIATFKFVREKSEGVQTEQVPFPWMPTAGAIFTAAGIIMMGTDKKRVV